MKTEGLKRSMQPKAPTSKTARDVAPADPLPERLPVGQSVVRVAVPPCASDAEIHAALARSVTRPEVTAAAVVEKWNNDTYDVNALAAELDRQTQAVNSGDMQRVEGMLIAQAHTLDAIFSNLMRRATNQQYMAQWEAYMRVGLKAQSQCRATLQALAEMKNPRPVAFVNQANINNGGQQQVNNGRSPVPTSEGGQRVRAREESAKVPNELLEDQSDGSAYLDSGAAAEATRSHSAVEAVAAIDRPKKRPR